jgi:hypothetical protein
VTPIHHRTTTAVVTLLTATGLAAGCSGSDQEATGGTDTPAVSDAPASDGTGDAADRDVATEQGAPSGDGEAIDGGATNDGATDDGATDGEAAGSQPETVVADRAAAGREVVRRASITLELEDPEDGVQGVTEVAERADGFVATADLRRDTDTGELSGRMTVRVPSGDLDATLDALEELAEDAPVRTIDEEDVTGQAVDLRAQLRNLESYEEQLRELLTDVREGTSDPDDLLPVVERVQSVRSDIDRLTAQLGELDDRVALSTIDVTLRPTASAEPVVTATWTPTRTFDTAAAATGRAFAAIADAAIWVAVAVLPVAVAVLGPPAVAGYVWTRRRGRVTHDHPGAAPTASA